MKEIILSADSNRYLYAGPNQVANNLDEYCQFFANDWLLNSLDVKKISRNKSRFNETHYILYLNTFVFPNEQSYLIKNLGWIDYENPMPKEYAGIPFFNF